MLLPSDFPVFHSCTRTGRLHFLRLFRRYYVARHHPQGGTVLFALLAMAGDLGGAFGPGLVGIVTQKAGDNLQAGMLAGSIFPLVLIIALILLSKM